MYSKCLYLCVTTIKSHLKNLWCNKCTSGLSVGRVGQRNSVLNLIMYAEQSISTLTLTVDILLGVHHNVTTA